MTCSKSNAGVMEGLFNLWQEDIVEVEGKITAVLPSTMFRAELENGHQVLAHISDKWLKHFIKITVGDHLCKNGNESTGFGKATNRLSTQKCRGEPKRTYSKLRS